MKDEIEFFIQAGDGGNGCVHWRREKYIPKGGPDGGNGGRGGDIYAKAIRNISALNRFKRNKLYRAEDGKDGMGKLMGGKNGEDLILEVPVGSIIKNIETGEVFDLVKEEQKELIAAGGDGGFGNTHFKSSRNTTPTKATSGIPGQRYKIFIELRLIADVGLIGLPSAGKSTLINEFTNTKAKVAAYPFTTLEPNLGVSHNIVFADIPGLIEGAAEGKGLGHSFLKHIARTRILLHLVSAEENDSAYAYNSIRKEIVDFDAKLENKTEIIILSKTDLIDETDLNKKLKELSAFGTVIPVSAFDDVSIKKVFDCVAKTLDKIANSKKL